jgi:hypothetical protein
MPLFTIINMTTMRMSLTIIMVQLQQYLIPIFPYLKSYQNHYYNEYREGILQIAKTFLNSLSNQLIDKTMVKAVKT